MTTAEFLIRTMWARATGLGAGVVIAAAPWPGPTAFTRAMAAWALDYADRVGRN